VGSDHFCDINKSAVGFADVVFNSNQHHFLSSLFYQAFSVYFLRQLHRKIKKTP
jgi:hypothetical protein